MLVTIPWFEWQFDSWDERIAYVTDLLDKAVGEARDEDAAVVTVDDATDGLADRLMDGAVNDPNMPPRGAPETDSGSQQLREGTDSQQVQVKSGHRRRRVVRAHDFHVNFEALAGAAAAREEAVAESEATDHEE